MSKSIKLKNNTYWDSKGITHNNKLLSDILYPVGSIYMSVNSTSPATLFGGTWTQISGRFLYCTTTSKTTGGASTHTHTQGATGASSGSTGGPSNNTSGGPSNNTSGSTTLTVNQIPSHQHQIKMRNNGKWDWNSGSAAGDKLEGGYCWDAGNVTFNWLIDNSPVGGNQGHTHTLSSHTHSLNSHTHSLNSHTHTNPTTASASSLPPYFTVYCWYRTA